MNPVVNCSYDDDTKTLTISHQMQGIDELGEKYFEAPDSVVLITDDCNIEELKKINEQGDGAASSLIIVKDADLKAGQVYKGKSSITHKGQVYRVGFYFSGPPAENSGELIG